MSKFLSSAGPDIFLGRKRRPEKGIGIVRSNRSMVALRMRTFKRRAGGGKWCKTRVAHTNRPPHDGPARTAVPSIGSFSGGSAALPLQQPDAGEEFAQMPVKFL